MLIAGVDAGMRFAKICLVEDRIIIASRCFEMDGNFRQRYNRALKDIIFSVRESGASSFKIKKVIATGYGASMVPHVFRRFDESSCLAAVSWNTPVRARTVIDAGGLFIKIHNLNDEGFVEREAVNDKCAAGSGRLLEIVSDALKIPLDTIASMDLSDADPYPITNSCAVFAESELISRVGNGIPAKDILAGVIRSLASKTASLLENSRGKDPVAITGGLSCVAAYVDMLIKISGREIAILSPGPRLAPAYGAVLSWMGVKKGISCGIKLRPPVPGRVR